MSNLPIPPQLLACAELLRRLDMGIDHIATELGVGRSALKSLTQRYPGQKRLRPARRDIVDARRITGLGDYRHGPASDERILALRRLIPADKTPLTEAEKTLIRTMAAERVPVKLIVRQLQARGLNPPLTKLRPIVTGCRPKTKLKPHEIQFARKYRGLGWTVPRVARELGCGKNLVILATAYGPPRPDLRRSLPRILQQLETMSRAEVAAYWSCSRSLINKILREHETLKRSVCFVLAA